jgi:protein involved in polysaccharide export with SLBB domain
MLSLAAVGVLSLSGCNSLLDQSEVARAEGDRLVVPILKSIDPIDEGAQEFEGASEVRPADLKVVRTDYVIGRGDLVTVSIFDLAVGGVETVRTARVSETGILSLPMLPEPIQAAGMTEQQLQGAVAEAYRKAELLQNARVSVTVVEARQRTFSIMGAVARPGQFAIVESDFRILDALIQAGDASTAADWLYVVRKISSETPSTQPANVPQPGVQPQIEPGQPGVDPLAPQGAAPADPLTPVLAAQPAQPATAAPATQPAIPPAAAAGDERMIVIDGKAIPLGATQPVGPRTGAPQPAAAAVDAAAPAQPMTEPVTQSEYEFGETLTTEGDQRVIRVPLAQLRNGDLRYNIVVRPHDLLIVPQPMPGFYYMGGHVGAPGAYNLTGQKINLKQAVAAARMLDPLAVPSRTDVIRRVGDSEVFVRVDLGKIYAGRQPDLYLKPNDVVVVGTDWYPPFLAAIRGAFRFTYGFGFIYDRNYAPEQEGAD